MAAVAIIINTEGMESNFNAIRPLLHNRLLNFAMASTPYISGLLYPQAKAARARLHLNHIEAYSAKFRSGSPYTIAQYDYPERGIRMMRITLNPLNLMLPIAIGECAHNLRSSLDHLAWQLGLLSGRTPSRSSAFPIHSSDSPRDRERFMRATLDIPCEAVEIIKSLQPHLRGKSMKSDPLWQLNKLCNLDKHVTVGSSHTLIQFKVLREGVTWRSLEDSQELEIFTPIDDDNTEPRFELHPPELIFGKPIDAPGADFWITERQLAAIHSYVSNDVLPRFGPFFPNCPTLADVTREDPSQNSPLQ
ncbi:MAG TPA: hypothetical protein DHW34_02155 [Actinobacteria bacterium]|nr:hypothetical protein [Actinomycetota bacterium]